MARLDRILARVGAEVRMAPAGAYSLLRNGRWHRGLYVRGRCPILDIKGTLRVQPPVVLRSWQFRPAISVEHGGTLVIGHHTQISQGANIHCSMDIRIGEHVQIGDLACIYDTNFHWLDEVTPPTPRPVAIADEVWLGRGVLVLPGSVIGRGTVVAAGSVVRGTVPPAVLAAGAPARPIKELRIGPDFWRT